MAFKEWFRRLQPMQLYLVLFFTTAFFIVELITSHVTHALTLLVNAYHMLCNIIALIGCIASIKYGTRENSESQRGSNSQLGNSATRINSPDGKFCSESSLSTKIKESQSDRRMKNTFGWARINILTMLVCCVFLGSFCFSLQVEALQTLVHIDHTDAMHQPLAVLCIGVAGIFLNIFCYILIGGYTFYHGNSLQVTNTGEVVLRRSVAVTPSNKQRESSVDPQNGSHCQLKLPGKQGFKGIFRDILGCVFVMLVSVLVHYTKPSVGKFIDPVIAIVSSISLFVLSYPYMKESGLILLQTIPNHINISSLKKELLAAFPGIVNVHDLHVWQLTGEKSISTAHIIFLDPEVYASIRHQVTNFFVEMGITQVTIQPEFQKMKPSLEKITMDCLIKCQGENCSESRCCSKDVSLDTGGDTKSINDDKTIESKDAGAKFERIEITQTSIAAPSDSKRFTQIVQATCENNRSESYSREKSNDDGSRNHIVCDISDDNEYSDDKSASTCTVIEFVEDNKNSQSLETPILEKKKKNCDSQETV